MFVNYLSFYFYLARDRLNQLQRILGYGCRPSAIAGHVTWFPVGTFLHLSIIRCRTGPSRNRWKSIFTFLRVPQMLKKSRGEMQLPPFEGRPKIITSTFQHLGLFTGDHTTRRWSLPTGGWREWRAGQVTQIIVSRQYRFYRTVNLLGDLDGIADAEFVRWRRAGRGCTSPLWSNFSCDC